MQKACDQLSLGICGPSMRAHLPTHNLSLLAKKYKTHTHKKKLRETHTHIKWGVIISLMTAVFRMQCCGLVLTEETNTLK